MTHNNLILMNGEDLSYLKIVNKLGFIKELSDLRKIRYELSICSLNTIQKVYDKIINSELLPPSFFSRWVGQNEKQVFIFNLFFPIEIEEIYGPLEFIYQNKKVHKKLQICSLNGDPLSMLYLAKIMDNYYKNLKIQCPDIKNKLVKISFSIVKNTLKSNQNCPNYYIGIYFDSIDYHINTNDERSKFKILCNQKNKVNTFIEYLKNYPPYFIYFGNQLKDNIEDKMKYYIKAANNYLPYGYFEAGILLLNNNRTIEGIEYLKLASSHGIMSASLILANYYKDISYKDKEIEFYNEAAINGNPYAYIKLGDIYKTTNKKESFKFYTLAGIYGLNYIYGMDIVKRESDDYFKKLLKGFIDN